MPGGAWKWIIPLGCLAMLLAGGVFVASILWIVMASIRSSAPYASSFQTATADCELQQILGTPIEPGWFISGSINVTGPAGEAQLSIPLKGPQSSAKMYVNATKSAGRWSYELMEVEPKGRAKRINLLEEERRVCR